MAKQKFKRAFGCDFLLIEGTFNPLHTTWAELAKEVKNPSGDLYAHRGKEIYLEKSGGIMGPIKTNRFPVSQRKGYKVTRICLCKYRERQTSY